MVLKPQAIIQDIDEYCYYNARLAISTIAKTNLGSLMKDPRIEKLKN